jgi:hypothetical protein
MIVRLPRNAKELFAWAIRSHIGADLAAESILSMCQAITSDDLVTNNDLVEEPLKNEHVADISLDDNWDQRLP